MTLEEFKRADEIISMITNLTEANEKIKKHMERVKLYQKSIKADKVIEFAGKKYKPVELKFYTEHPTDVYIDDMFDLIGENITDFNSFLKKCVSNYEKKIKDNENTIETLKKEFASLGNKNEQAA